MKTVSKSPWRTAFAWFVLIAAAAVFFYVRARRPPEPEMGIYVHIAVGSDEFRAYEDGRLVEWRSGRWVDIPMWDGERLMKLKEKVSALESRLP
jgi:hypothetical protein